MKTTNCEHCGDPLPHGHGRWCKKRECIQAAENEQRRQIRESWRRTYLSRQAQKQRIPYNPRPCELCKQPLGHTYNQFYHPDCHKRITGYLCGIEEANVAEQ